MTSISGGAFKYCTSLSSITIPETIEKVGDGAFEGCTGLTSATLSKKMTAIADNTFYGCTSLSSIAIPDEIETIGVRAFARCTSLNSISLPKNLTSIKDRAFEGSGLSGFVTIPEGVTSIGSYAFSHCNSLLSPLLPFTLTTIGSYAFYECDNLGYAIVPYSVKTIGDYAFAGSTKLVYLQIDEDTFKNSPDTIIKSCPNAVTIYNQYAVKDEVVTDGGLEFKVTNASKNGNGTVTLTKAVSPASSVVIPKYVKIKDCTYKVTKIADKAFYQNTTITSVYIQENVATIGKSAFLGCANLTKVSGGKSITTIGDQAFAACPMLNTFIITSSSLKKIGTFAFSKDVALTEIYINKTTKLTKTNVKKSLKNSSVKTVRVKKSKVSAYKKIFTKANAGRKVTVKK